MHATRQIRARKIQISCSSPLRSRPFHISLNSKISQLLHAGARPLKTIIINNISQLKFVFLIDELLNYLKNNIYNSDLNECKKH